MRVCVCVEYTAGIIYRDSSPQTPEAFYNWKVQKLRYTPRRHDPLDFHIHGNSPIPFSLIFCACTNNNNNTINRVGGYLLHIILYIGTYTIGVHAVSTDAARHRRTGPMKIILFLLF